MSGLAEFSAAEWGDPAVVYDLHDDTVDPFHPEWHQLAACRGQMVDGFSLWFSPNVRDRAEARRICNNECPVKAECDAARKGQHGVWAGQVDPHPVVHTSDVGLAS